MRSLIVCLASCLSLVSDELLEVTTERIRIDCLPRWPVVVDGPIVALWKGWWLIVRVPESNSLCQSGFCKFREADRPATVLVAIHDDFTPEICVGVSEVLPSRCGVVHPMEWDRDVIIVARKLEVVMLSEFDDRFDGDSLSSGFKIACLDLVMVTGLWREVGKSVVEEEGHTCYSC
ncbi:hypothetical protein [Natrinema ejinorense]|uniref:hypothetical protein n=1 Tax=Natrinema ejinorense TaxID=373386 RepID=UPI001FEAE97F|nr:hypothetical protein [Natrinema ejinorense]